MPTDFNCADKLSYPAKDNICFTFYWHSQVENSKVVQVVLWHCDSANNEILTVMLYA